MPRNDLTLAGKIALLDEIKRQPANSSKRQLARITGVPKSTIARLMQQEVELRDQWMIQDGGRSRRSQRRKRDGKYPEVELALAEWYHSIVARDVAVSGMMLKCKATELARNSGHLQFLATDGWLARWKSRHGIVATSQLERQQNGFHRRSETGDRTSSVAQQMSFVELSAMLEAYGNDDIYCADETALLYRATPNGALAFSHSALLAGQHALDRVTVLCSTNLSGVDRRPPLIIGRWAKPKSFDALSAHQHPVRYCTNRYAWMTPEIFDIWLRDWDEQLEQEGNRRVLLLLVLSEAHQPASIELEQLSNIQLAFVPIDEQTDRLLHPMHMGIIRAFKIFYRRGLLRHIKHAIERSLLTRSSTAIQVSATITLFQAAQLVAEALQQIPVKIIELSFAHCGYRQTLTTTMNNSILSTVDASNNVELQAAISELSQIDGQKEFLCVDDGLQCSDNNSVEATVQRVLIEQQETHDTDGEAENEYSHLNSNEVEWVSDQDALECVGKLQHFFMQHSNDDRPLWALDACVQFVLTHVSSADGHSQSADSSHPSE